MVSKQFAVNPRHPLAKRAGTLRQSRQLAPQRMVQRLGLGHSPMTRQPCSRHDLRDAGGRTTVALFGPILSQPCCKSGLDRRQGWRLDENGH